MTRCRLTVALLLVMGLAQGAAAGENQDQIKASKKAKAINAYLDKVGLNSPQMRRFSQGVQERLEGDYLRLAEQRFEHGRVVFFYEVEPKLSTRQLVLKYQPDNSNVEYIATTKAIMVNYTFNF